jgi:hypothetical protein
MDTSAAAPPRRILSSPEVSIHLGAVRWNAGCERVVTPQQQGLLISSSGYLAPLAWKLSILAASRLTDSLVSPFVSGDTDSKIFDPRNPRLIGF